MRLAYDRHMLDYARIDAAQLGHAIRGRFRRCWTGQAWQAHCAHCRAYVLVTPPLARHGAWEYTGPAITDACPARTQAA